MRLNYSIVIIGLVLVLLLPGPLSAQYSRRSDNDQKVEWTGVVTEKYSDYESKKFIGFKGAVFNDLYLPVINKQVELRDRGSFDYDFTATETGPVSPEEYEILKTAHIKSDFEITTSVGTSRKLNYGTIEIVPFRKNNDGTIEKLMAYRLTTSLGSRSSSQRSNRSFAAHSVLQPGTGDWYKIGVVQTGIFKLDYNFFINNGLDPSDLVSDNIHLFGNSFGMLPITNSDYRPDDLLENAIKVYDGGDGTIDAGDYILFYARQPDNIRNNGSYFWHVNNTYCDTSYYFINIDPNRSPKRIQTGSNDPGTPTHVVTSFSDYQYIEKDQENFIKSGSEWYGDIFDLLTTRTYTFNFSNITSSTATVVAEVLGKYHTSSNYVMSETNTGSSTLIGVPALIQSAYAPYAATGRDTLQFNPTSGNVSIKLTYNKPDASAKGWLNTIKVNARRQLLFGGSSLQFRDLQSAGTGNIAEYRIQNGTQVSEIWEVTNPDAVVALPFNTSSNLAIFQKNADSLREFVALSGTGFPAPTFVGNVSNQDLHGLPEADYLIIVHPQFLSEAERLANFHRDRGLTVHVVTTSQIYNEFSSGMQDASGLRDFIRMFYERAGGDPSLMPDYVLLFGDGSYDNKHRFVANQNYVVTYQSANSLDASGSFTSDDYFGLLDPGESMDKSDLLDVGVGRFCVKSIDEARNVVNKTIHYATNSAPLDGGGHTCDIESGPATLGNWRNIIAIVADDEDQGDYVYDSESYYNSVQVSNPEINVDKIYLDAYVQESTPGGERYYDVEKAFDSRVKNGCLILNYIGHGGEAGLAHERVLNIPTINAWQNLNSLPLFMTATCEFSRFDDPVRTSAGELVLLNPNGGGFALFTTTRLVYAFPNSVLNGNFYSFIFDEVSGDPLPIGDVFRMTKNATAGSSNNFRNFTLLGDPALPLSIPRHNVITDSVNNLAISISDTLGALSTVTVTGHIENNPGGGLKTDFNGYVFPTVYDKVANLSTLANNTSSPTINFESWRNVIYKGKASVVNGEFRFSFVVPKDIAYQIGPGRISYYAHNGTIDAHGFTESIYIGGADTSALADNTGPEIDLYMNDENFVSGGTTNENPKLYAVVFDDNGINTVGNGIGHDITAILDENTGNAIILNDYYESDLDTYKSGKISYPFSKLEDGEHTLSLKVWDVHNNSSSTDIEFVVANSEEMALSHVLNYPNPFTTNTTFFFEHNQYCENLDVQIQVFTISGKLVKTLNQTVHTEGFKIDGISWNGLDDYGDQIGKGVYVYKLLVYTPDGDKAEETEKLVILR